MEVTSKMRKETVAALIFFSVIILTITLSMAGIPRYRVWTSTLAGEAELKKAEWDRQIAVREAEAKRDSAKLLAQAEIERAKGVAEANKIIGDSLRDNEQYLRYLWVDSLSHTKDQIVYIPTEAGMPILESGRTNNNKVISIMRDILK